MSRSTSATETRPRICGGFVRGCRDGRGRCAGWSDSGGAVCSRCRAPNGRVVVVVAAAYVLHSGLDSAREAHRDDAFVEELGAPCHRLEELADAQPRLHNRHLVRGRRRRVATPSSAASLRGRGGGRGGGGGVGGAARGGARIDLLRHQKGAARVESGAAHVGRRDGGAEGGRTGGGRRLVRAHHARPLDASDEGIDAEGAVVGGARSEEAQKRRLRKKKGGEGVERRSSERVSERGERVGGEHAKEAEQDGART